MNKINYVTYVNRLTESICELYLHNALNYVNSVHIDSMMRSTPPRLELVNNPSDQKSLSSKITYSIFHVLADNFPINFKQIFGRVDVYLKMNSKQFAL